MEEISLGLNGTSGLVGIAFPEDNKDNVARAKEFILRGFRETFYHESFRVLTKGEKGIGIIYHWVKPDMKRY